MILASRGNDIARTEDQPERGRARHSVRAALREPNRRIGTVSRIKRLNYEYGASFSPSPLRSGGEGRGEEARRAHREELSGLMGKINSMFRVRCPMFDVPPLRARSLP
jgi:hypothetical protein